MAVGPQTSVFCLRLTSFVAFCAVCGQLFEMLPPDEMVEAGFAWSFMFMAWLGLNVLGLLTGMALVRLWKSPPHLLLSISWAIAVAAGFALSLFDPAEVSLWWILEFAIGLVLLSVPFVGGWSWSLGLVFKGYDAAHSGG